jgi:hypothetical protein
MFAGTSAGALVTCALVYGQRHCSELLCAYTPSKLAAMFDKSVCDRLCGFCQFKPKYDGRAKRTLLEAEFGNTSFYGAPNNKVVIVPVYDVDGSCVKVFDSTRPDEDEDEAQVRDIVDASSSAPVYFPGTAVNGKTYVDGGIAMNDPVVCAILLAKKLLENTQRRIVVLSVGTGFRKRNLTGMRAAHYGGIQWARYLLGVALENSSVSLEAKVLGSLRGCEYVRINGDLGTIDSAMDNTDPSNMAALCDLGRRWWQEDQDRVLGALGVRTRKPPLVDLLDTVQKDLC